MKGASVGKRTGSLLLAIALAALASVALVSYVNGLEKKAYAGVETVEIWVATEVIPAGTSIEDAQGRGMVEKTRIPRKVIAQGAVTDLAPMRGRVANVSILPGEQIVSARFVDRDKLGATLAIPEGRQAISVEVNLPPAVAGFIQPGSRVSMISNVKVPAFSVDRSAFGRNAGRALSGGNADEDISVVKFVVQDVPVLWIGRRAAPPVNGERAETRENSGNETLDGRVLVTLAVTPADAEKVAFATLEGQVYFTLLPEGQKPVRTPGRTKYNIFI